MKYNIILILCALFVWSACSDDPAPQVAQRESPDMGAGEDTPEPDLPEPEEDLPPPGPVPAGVALGFDPVRPLYRPGINLQPSLTFYDSDGNVIDPLELPSADVVWTLDPPEAAELQGTGRYRIMGEGQITFTGCLGATDLCATRTLTSDATPPSIEILSPAPGAQLSGLTQSTILLEGRVTDTHGELSLVVDGVPLALAEDGGFSKEISPLPGVNHIELSATDGLQPEDTATAIDVLWAPSGYLAPESEGVVTLPDGLAIDLGQRFFDDGVPLPPVSEEPGEVLMRDLAGVVELLLQEADFLSQLTNPILDQEAARLSLTDIRVIAPEVQINLLEDGLEVFLRLGQIKLGTEGQLTLQGESLDLTGSILASASAAVRLRLSKDGVDAPYIAELVNTEIALEELSPRFADAQTNALVSFAQGALRGTLEELLLQDIVDDFAQQLPTLFVDALMSLEQGLAGLNIDLDTGLTPPITLQLEAALRNLNYTPGVSLSASLQTSLVTGAPSVHPEGEGVPMLSQTPGVGFVNQRRLQLGGPMTLLNGILYSLWDAGMLDVPVLDLLPPEFGILIIDADITPRLPPVARPVRPGEPAHDMIITLGQFEFNASFAQQDDVYGIQVQIGADLALEEGQLTLTLAAEPVLRVWVISSTNESGTRFTARALEGALLLQLWPALEGLLSEGLAVPLPVLDLGDQVSALAPGVEDLRLVPVQDRDIRIEDGFFLFDGNLEGRAFRRGQ